MLLSICNEWEFVSQWMEAFGRGERNGESIRLPHTVRKVLAPYASLPVQLKVEDDIVELAGPRCGIC